MMAYFVDGPRAGDSLWLDGAEQRPFVQVLERIDADSMYAAPVAGAPAPQLEAVKVYTYKRVRGTARYTFEESTKPEEKGGD